MEDDIAYAGGGKKYCSNECKRSGKSGCTGGFRIQRSGHDERRDQKNRGSICKNGNSRSFQ